MLISHKHKFVTIDVPKTGTLSITSALRRVVGENDFTTKMSREMGMRHATYEQCIKKFPSCKKYFVFAFVRNPWDRLLSFYYFKKHNAINKITQDMTFKYFVSSNKVHLVDQYSYIDGFGDFSFVGRFENLQQDFNIVCDKIGIPQQQLPHRNKTDHKHYTEYYDDETRQMVAERYAKDIEYFGYKFGE
jgi:phosphoribosyl 1,2-cyclic phosphodiesterase